MFEAFFNLRVAPFQLAPDADFYFPSRGHSHALAYLKFGVYQQEGFIVVTGDIGAGKTTLVRTLLSGVDPQQVIAAQLVSTQLNEGELLASICNAFGVPVPGSSKANLIAALEAFFTAVAVGGRRALLIVDEAQNLGKRETEELRMLSNFQIGNRALLQSFLVGQPELRGMLASPALEQLRQRVIASCHLGGLDERETQAYIEHRLRHAGWEGEQIFDDGALHAIHARTGGIPRRINLLCTRLLLGAFLASERCVAESKVLETAAELGLELSVAPKAAAA
jgi:general secretion pathway protein A